MNVSGWGANVWVSLQLDPGVTYDLRAPDLRDVLGNKLAKPLVMQVRSEDLPPELMAPVEETSFIGHHGTHRPGRDAAAALGASVRARRARSPGCSAPTVRPGRPSPPGSTARSPA